MDKHTLITDAVSVQGEVADVTTVRLFYAALLMEFPRNRIATWFDSWYADAGFSGMAADWLEVLWKSEGRVPVAFEARFYRELDRFLINEGLNPDDFAEKAFRRFSEEPVLSAKSLLKSLRPHMPAFYSTHDQRQLILKLLADLHAHSHCEWRLIDQAIRYGRRNDLVMFLPRQWSEQFAEFHFARYRLGGLRYSPIAFGLPAFEECRLRVDMREAQAILDRAGLPSRIADGRVSGLFDFLTSIGHNVNVSDLEDCQGMVFANDVLDEATGRILLKSGVFYGARCSMAEIRYATALGKVVNPFEKLVGQMVDPEVSVWNVLRERHELLVEEMRSVVEVVYHASDDSISVGNQHLMRNVPAKILRNVLREYTATGRSEFENREFRRDQEICMDPLNPNFEGRLNRLIERLQRLPGVMEIEKVRRGGFLFRPLRSLRFQELP